MKKLFLLSLLFAAVLSKTFAQRSCPPVYNLTVSNITNTSATFDWEAGPFTVLNVYDAYSLEYKPSSSSVWTWFGANSPMHQVVSVFSPGTTYDVRVTGQYYYGSGTCPPAEITFTTTGSAPPPVPYCTTKGLSTTYGWINSVKIGTINNVSGNNNGYANFTNLSTSVPANTPISITVQAAAKKTPKTQLWTVFFDINNDGDFFDTGETIGNFATTAGEISTNNIAFPTTLTGNHRMRITMVYILSGPAGPCGTYAYGESEDYTVNITTPAASISNPSNKEITSTEPVTNNAGLLIYPNPASDNLTISYTKGTISNFKIYDISGRLVIEKANLSENKSLNISQLQRGSYLVALTTGSGVITQKFIKN